MKITITHQDVINNPNYSKPRECPCARKLQEALNDPEIQMCWGVVSKADPCKVLGHLNPPFYRKHFDALKNGEITEFVTEYTPI